MVDLSGEMGNDDVSHARLTAVCTIIEQNVCCRHHQDHVPSGPIDHLVNLDVVVTDAVWRSFAINDQGQVSVKNLLMSNRYEYDLTRGLIICQFLFISG